MGGATAHRPSGPLLFGKSFGFGDCKMGLLVGDMKAYQTTLIQSDSTTSILCKRHAYKLFMRATGISAARPYQGATFSLASPRAPVQNQALDNLVTMCRQMSQARSDKVKAQFCKR